MGFLTDAMDEVDEPKRSLTSVMDEIDPPTSLSSAMDEVEGITTQPDTSLTSLMDEVAPLSAQPVQESNAPSFPFGEKAQQEEQFGTISQEQTSPLSIVGEKLSSIGDFVAEPFKRAGKKASEDEYLQSAGEVGLIMLDNVFKAVKGTVSTAIQTSPVISGPAAIPFNDKLSEIQDIVNTPTKFEQYVEGVKKDRIGKALKEGGVPLAAVQATADTIVEMIPSLLMQKFVVGKAFPWQNQSMGAKAVLTQAGKVSAYRYVTTVGTEKEKAKTAAITFAYYATPAASMQIKGNWAARLTDIALNLGITGTTQSSDWVDMAKATAKEYDDPNWQKYMSITATPAILSDVMMAWGTKSKYSPEWQKAHAAYKAEIENKFGTKITKEEIPVLEKTDEIPIAKEATEPIKEASPLTQAMDEVEGVAKPTAVKVVAETEKVAQKLVKDTSEPLIEEAKKFDKVEDFVASQKIKTEVFYHRNVEVIKNPSNSDLRQLTKEFRKEFPQGRGEPAVRTTFDEEGNKYIWRADKSTHSDIESFIKKEFGLEANQNESMLEKPIRFIGKNVDAIVTKSAKEEGKWQATFYDKEGRPSGDVIRDTYKEAVDEARRTTGKLSGEQINASREFEKLSDEQLTEIFNKAQEGKKELPPHLQKIADKQKGVETKIEDVTPKGFGVEEAKGEVRVIEALKNETTDKTIERVVGNQIDNGVVKLEETKDGWKAKVLKGEKPLTFSAFKKQDVLNQVFKEMFPDSTIKKAEVKVEKKPEIKVSGLSKTIMKEAIAKGLAEDFGDLPTYKVRNQKGELANKITDFIEKEPELAKKIALNEVPEQGGMRSQEIFKALSIKAILESDINTIQELAKSQKAADAATELGQRIQALDTGLNNDPIKTIRNVIKSREESKAFKGREKELKILKVQLTETERQLASREKEIERIQKKQATKGKRKKFGETNKIFTKKVYDEAQQSLRARLSTLSAGVDPTALVDLTKIGGFYFEGGLRDFSSWSKNLVSEFGVKVKPYLRKAWSNVKTDFDNQEKNLVKSVKTLKETQKEVASIKDVSPEKAIERTKKSLEKRMAEYERRIKEADFSLMKKETKPLSTPDIDELRGTLKVLKEEYNALKPSKERTNEQLLKSLKTRMTNEIKRLEENLEQLNFDKKVRRETILDAEGLRLRTERDRIKLAVSAAQSVGPDITKAEVSKIVGLTKEMNNSLDQIEKSGDWTSSNENNVMNYWEKRGELEGYVEGLKPVSSGDVANNFINYMRASILASPRILRNSFLYQVVPGIERTITKRLVTGAFNDADLKSNVVEKMMAKMSGLKMNAETLKFIKKQVAMAVKIYHKTGYDISRMDKLGERSKYFGEKAGTIKGKGVLAKFAKVVNLAPKWLAGGTDTLFANIGRADTALMMSKEIAKIEALKDQLPKGVTEKERADQLLKDSYLFDPKDKRANDIRQAGILDAHMMNNTQPGAWSDGVLAFRRLMTTKGINWGKAIIPFAKIANVVVAEGAKTATGFGIANSLVKINKATKIENTDNRASMMREGVTDLVRYVGLAGATLLVTGLLDDDDFVGAWDTISRKDYDISRARGAGTNYVRIGGKWIPLRYLPMINIPIAAVMTARQAKSRGGSAIQGYLSGIIGQTLDAPGIKEGRGIFKKIGWAVKSKTPEKALSSLGLDGEGLMKWAKVRMIPSVLSYDVYNALFKPDSKYDFLGRDIQKGGMFRDDKTNDVILEINRLHQKGKAPAISDPNTKYAQELELKMGEEDYQEYLAGLKKVYAEKIETLINSSMYKTVSNEKKMKMLNKRRKWFILNKIKRKVVFNK